MPTVQKAKVIDNAKEWYANSVGIVFADYRGLKVQEIQSLRQNLRAKGAELHVLKNTLFRLAAGDDIQNMPDELHNGPTAMAFIMQNEPDCAKAIFDFAQTNKNLTVKGGYFAGKAFSAADVEKLSKLPPRDVLIAQVIGAIAAPLSNLVGVVEALYADPIRVIGAVADKVAEGSPLPEAKAEAPAEPVAEAAAEVPAAEAPAEEAAPAAEEALAEAPAEEAPASDEPSA